MAWEENPRICLHMQLIAILSRTGVKYLGIDGTPVGKFGGMIPYDMMPSYPQITKMNVAAKTTADGKLSVEIGVSAAQ